jgi:hypothetical protein
MLNFLYLLELNVLLAEKLLKETFPEESTVIFRFPVILGFVLRTENEEL